MRVNGHAILPSIGAAAHAALTTAGLALGALAMAAPEVGELELIAMISVMAEQQGETYDLSSIRLSDVRPSANGSEGWVCGTFVGRLGDGRPAEPREFVANHAQRRIFLQPPGIGTTAEQYDQGANFYDASATWC